VSIEGDHVTDRTQSVEQKEVRYSARVMAEASHPSNMGRMPDPDAQGIIHGCCGDTMEIYLRLDGDHIQEATFATDGAESAKACASVLTQMLRGLSLQQASKVAPEDLIAALNGLPKPKVHCAKLTVNTLQQALESWRAQEGA
jgi:nitrogen fixation NifU-like protein